MKKLPTFKGYTMDIRLKQFRIVTNKGIEFLEFDSEEGDVLLAEYIKTVDKDSKEFDDLKNIF